MDLVYLRGVHFIRWLQQFSGLEPLFTHVSNLGSPLTTYSLVFPLAYYVDPLLGMTTMLCASFSEWISGILKWILFGHRPYWWVLMYAKKTNTPVIPIEQFPITCETGPGSPSGHCMITLSSLVPLVFYLYRVLPSFYRDLVMSMFGCFVLLLGLSRCYLAAHFPHQVVAGTVCGFTMGYLFYLTIPHPKSAEPSQPDSDSHWERQLGSWFRQLLSKPGQLAYLGVGSFVGAWLFSWTLQTIGGVNIDWSIEWAQKACKRADWVHLSTSLMVGFARIAGYLCGLTVALQLNPPLAKSISEAYLSPSVIPLGVTAFAATKLLESICHHVFQSFTSAIFTSTNGTGPGSMILVSSVLEASVGPLFSVWFLPRLLSWTKLAVK